MVPVYLSLDKLTTSIERQKARLLLQRAPMRFPTEVPGSAHQWWVAFLAEERLRQENQCAQCRELRKGLAKITISKNMSRELQSELTRKKTDLTSKLMTHIRTDECDDDHVVPEPPQGSILDSLLRHGILPLNLRLFFSFVVCFFSSRPTCACAA